MIYGSTAIKHWFPDYPNQPKDVDILSPQKQKESDCQWHPLLEKVLSYNSDSAYLDPDLLYTFKISHLSYPIKWDKHMKDALFLKQRGACINQDVYDLLMQVWEEVHSDKFGSKKRISLNKQVSDFFTKTVERRFEHDWLHEQFAFYEHPLHEKIRKSDTNPLPSKELWDGLTFDDKLKCALEECYVIASERFVFIEDPLPQNIAFVKAVKHLITNMTKGWFNQFLKENFLEILEYPRNHFYTVLDTLRD